MAMEPLPPASAAVLDPQQQQRRLQKFLDRDRRPVPGRHPSRATNDVSDILGARPLLKNHVFVHKPHFYDARDIKGSVSKELHPRNRRVGADERFQQLPIEGSTPQPAGFRTDRVVNPLAPEYKLPSFTRAPAPEPKFLRDSYDVSDIEGSRMRSHAVAHPRDAMKLDDIAGAQAGWLPRHKRPLRENPPRDILDVLDIINVDFKSGRVTNVLNPVYKVNGMTYEDDPLSRPLAQHPKRDKPSYALQTADIEGASCADPATTVVAGIVMKDRRGFRETNATADITGAKADTLLHSIRSTRRVDPNDPRYTALNGSQVDSSAISAGKSIVFAALVKQHEELAAAEAARRGSSRENQQPYVVSGVGNVGLLGPVAKEKKPPAKGKRTSLSGSEDAPPDAPPVSAAKAKTELTPAITTGRTGAASRSSSAAHAASSGASGSARRQSSAERKQALERREEIQLVRELS